MEIGLNIDQIACGMHHTLARSNEPSYLFSWGFGEAGRLGTGTDDMQCYPCRVPLPYGDVLSIGAGEQHSLALMDSGTVVAWGSNAFGQLGIGTMHEKTVAIPMQVS